MQVKICGITLIDDALVAVDAGADALGLIFYEGSPRGIDVEQAREIVSAVPPYTTVTALFVNPERSLVERVLKAVPISQIQFHGNESAQFCQGFGRPYVKSIAVSTDDEMQQVMREHSASRAFLFDTLVPGKHGGTGKTFDWTKIPTKNVGHRVLAGGLNAENVAEAIRIGGPDAVDVSSGVESSAGVKDHDLVRRFIAAAKQAGKEIT
ncbi:phosphoribosylanthranilate isomerase [Luminiphilus sp.]|nr:phosphoribosylanthranilate isomerase [Luminiphilus sp.]MDB3933828.1 phosphoribosylanthranilate isomerase [Luminiphilus sp.]MDC3392894.1 phosphoribosylanthranilate isomerase [Luminiphilus sp.]